MLVDDVLTYAVAIARKKGHARIGDAHVIIALCTRPEVQRYLNAQGYCAARLDAHVRAALAAEPDVRAYRNAVAPEVPAELRRALEGARGRGLLRLFRGANASELFEVVAARNEISGLRWELGPLKQLYRATTDVARARGHRNVLIDHALVALASSKADDGRFATALRALGHEPEAVRKGFRDRLTRRFIGVRLAPFAKLMAFASARSNLAERTELGIDFIVLDILQQPRAEKAFVAAGISRADFVAAYERAG